MDKKRIRITINVLEEIKNEFPETAEFIFSFYITRSKKLAQRNIFYFIVPEFKVEMFLLHLTKHVKLNSLSHAIYLGKV